MTQPLSSILLALMAVQVGADVARAADTAPELKPSAELTKVVAEAVSHALERFAEQKLKDEDLAVTVIDLRDPDRLSSGSFRGDAPIFPASVVKLFYFVAAHQWLEDGKLQPSEELSRTMRDMIVDSSNDATAMIVDALTETLNGAPLPAEEMNQWAERRNVINRYFAGLGYTIGAETGINVCQKTYCEGPYGRERIFFGPKFENRNKLTTDATARLMAQIVLGRSVSTERSQQMMDLLRRDPGGKGDSQASDFIAAGLPPDTKLWSKAGWTSTARHDAAYVETGDGLKAVIAIFTTGHARQREILPFITGEIVASLQQSHPQ